MLHVDISFPLVGTNTCDTSCCWCCSCCYAAMLQVCRLGERSLKSLKQFFARDEDESFRWRIAASLRTVNTLGNAMTTVRATRQPPRSTHRCGQPCYVERREDSCPLIRYLKLSCGVRGCSVRGWLRRWVYGCGCGCGCCRRVAGPICECSSTATSPCHHSVGLPPV
eukprot:COSAG06_NODE_3078_length_5888_cov_24.975643_5_plen_167_part_00